MAEAPLDTESLAGGIKNLDLSTDGTDMQTTVAPGMEPNKRTRRSRRIKGKLASQEHSTEEPVNNSSTADGHNTINRATTDGKGFNSKKSTITTLGNETTATTTLPTSRRKPKATTNRYIPPQLRPETTSDRTTTEQNKSNNLPYRLLQQPAASTPTPSATYPRSALNNAQAFLDPTVADAQVQRAYQYNGHSGRHLETTTLSNDLSTKAPLSARDARALARNAYRASQEASSPRPPKSPILYLLLRPTPTKSYLHLSSLPPTQLPARRPLLVILDLNGTLLHRTTRGGSTFAERPHLQSFLTYLLTHHRVMIWSSARRENVTAMVFQLFPSPAQHAQLAAIWARDTLRLTPAQTRQRVQVYKQLSWVWADGAIQATAPSNDPLGLGRNVGRWSQADTVLLDDSEEKAAAEPYNLLKIEAFEDRVEQRETDVLGQVVQYLEGLRWQADVSAFMRLRPFVAR